MMNISAKNIVQAPADKPYAVLELPADDADDFESTEYYAVPACTAWLENISIKMSKTNGKQATFAGACKWPSDESKLSDYLEKKKKPANTWITYKNVKILKFCKSVRQAKEEVEKALDVSDLSHSDRDKSTKRQRFVTTRYSPPLKAISYNRRKSNNIDADDDSDNDSEFKAPAVPNLKISGKKKNNEASLPVNVDSDTDESNLDDNCTQETQKDCNSDTETSETYRNSDRYNNKNVMTKYDHNKNFDVPISSSLYGSQVSDTIRMTHTSINDNVDGVNDVTDLVHRAHTKEKEKSNIQDLQTNKQDKVVCRNENSNSTNSCKAMQQSQVTREPSVNLYKKSPIKMNATVDIKTIMTAISDLRNRIDTLHVTVRKIYTATCHPIETLENSTTNIPTLPLTSIEEFWKWEDYILDEENKLMIISLLVEHGREDLKSSVYCIMRKLMNNKVAMNFNLKGINREGARMEKKKFLDTTSYKLVIAALKRHKKEMTDRDVHFLYNTEIAASYIASWLKDAKKRHENEELKLKKIEQRDKDLENNANA